MRNINYPKLLVNVQTMINTAEFDAERSAGKAKMNAQDLLNLYALEAKIEAKIPKAKPTPAKKEG